MTSRTWNLHHADGRKERGLTTDDLLDRWPADPFDIVMVSEQIRSKMALVAYSAVSPDVFAVEQPNDSDGEL